MRDRRVVISHTHVLQDNDDLTLGAMNPWRTQTLFHLLPRRWRKSAYVSIFVRSLFVVQHSLQECDSSFRGGPTVSHRWWSRAPIAGERHTPDIFGGSIGLTGQGLANAYGVQQPQASLKNLLKRRRKCRR